MSKIGKRPIKIPEGIKVDIAGEKIAANFEGKNCQLTLPENIRLIQKGDYLMVNTVNNDKDSKTFSGLYARLVSNMLIGLKNNFTKELIFTGTGYRASIDNNVLVMFMGYSHDIKMPVPDGLTCTVKKNSITISGIEKRAVGSFAAEIRKIRPPEVYKGKGIRYKDEIIKRKAGKRAATV